MVDVLPSKMENFLVADNVRQEMGGKTTIIGAIAGGRLQIPKGTALPCGFPLAIFAVFDDGEGTFEVKLNLVGPANLPIMQNASVGTFPKTREQALQILINIGMFIVPSIGTYKAELSLNSKVYTQSFSVTFAPDEVKAA